MTDQIRKWIQNFLETHKEGRIALSAKTKELFRHDFGSLEAIDAKAPSPGSIQWLVLRAGEVATLRGEYSSLFPTTGAPGPRIAIVDTKAEACKHIEELHKYSIDATSYTALLSLSLTEPPEYGDLSVFYLEFPQSPLGRSRAHQEDVLLSIARKAAQNALRLLHLKWDEPNEYRAQLEALLMGDLRLFPGFSAAMASRALDAHEEIRVVEHYFGYQSYHPKLGSPTTGIEGLVTPTRVSDSERVIDGYSYQRHPESKNLWKLETPRGLPWINLLLRNPAIDPPPLNVHTWLMACSPFLSELSGPARSVTIYLDTDANRRQRYQTFSRVTPANHFIPLPASVDESWSWGTIVWLHLTGIAGAIGPRASEDVERYQKIGETLGAARAKGALDQLPPDVRYQLQLYSAFLYGLLGPTNTEIPKWLGSLRDSLEESPTWGALAAPLRAALDTLDAGTGDYPFQSLRWDAPPEPLGPVDRPLGTSLTVTNILYCPTQAPGLQIADLYATVRSAEQLAQRMAHEQRFGEYLATEDFRHEVLHASEKLFSITRSQTGGVLKRASSVFRITESFDGMRAGPKKPLLLARSPAERTRLERLWVHCLPTTAEWLPDLIVSWLTSPENHARETNTVDGILRSATISGIKSGLLRRNLPAQLTGNERGFRALEKLDAVFQEGFRARSRALEFHWPSQQNAVVHKAGGPLFRAMSAAISNAVIHDELYSRDEPLKPPPQGTRTQEPAGVFLTYLSIALVERPHNHIAVEIRNAARTPSKKNGRTKRIMTDCLDRIDPATARVEDFNLDPTDDRLWLTRFSFDLTSFRRPQGSGEPE